MNRLGLGLAVGAGYLLGRTKKMKLAFAVGTMVAGKRMNLSPRGIADLVSQQLQNNPQFKEIGDQLREDLRGVGKAASGALVERQIEGLADRLHGRTAQVRDQLAGVTGNVPGRGGEKDERYEDEQDEDDERYEDDAYDDREVRDDRDDREEEPDEEPEEEPERRPRAARAPAKKAASGKPSAGRGAARKAAEAGEAPAKKAAAVKKTAKKAPAKAPAKKAAAKKVPAKKTAAKKTAVAGETARGVRTARSPKGGGDR
ncbi:DNA primase [Streptomyces poonensis]|uniref:DNA primase n=1 Tax=Streptomyces poonensis TaxID=68255 RepID=A0A918UFN4_9ACTN|nr:DNA primase [Streptomyces poonensis]GGZ05096.1 hypothetical protein GCM10010365_25200 [Streptomyces poonensis]GLJ89466.1 hypothetical protein GCM10017589_20660 [Streptomyces poonensis]